MSYPRFTQLIIRVWFQSWPFRCKMHPTNRSKICQDMLFSLISALLHVVRNTKKPLNTVLSVRCGHESPQLSLINITQWWWWRRSVNVMLLSSAVCKAKQWQKKAHPRPHQTPTTKPSMGRGYKLLLNSFTCPSFRTEGLDDGSHIEPVK